MCAGRWRARSAGHAPRTAFNKCKAIACLMAVALVFSELAYPWQLTINANRMAIEKSEAYAIAPVLAGAGIVLKEIAIQAGLTIGAVAVTDAVLSTTATGKSVYDEPVSYGSYAGELPPAAPNRPNWPLWENMTAEQKAAWGNSETEYKNAYTAVCTSKVLGIEDYYDELRTWQANGGAEADKPEPDAATKEKLQKFGQAGKQWAKGGAVAMGTVGGMIAFESLLDFLFGSGEESLGYPTNFNIVSSSGRSLPFVVMPYMEVGTYTSNEAVCVVNNESGPTYYAWRTIEDPSQTLSIGTDNRVYIPGVSYQAVHYPNYTNIGSADTNNTYQIGTWYYQYYLNASYPGGFSLPDGGTFINGVVEGDATVDSQYSPIEDTPTELSTSVGNTQNVINNFTDISITQDPETGKYPSIVVPSDGIDPETTKYPDLITDGATTPDEDIDTGEEPDNPDEPDDPDNPNEDDFGEQLREKLLRLFEAPVKNVFPFCLILDLRDYFGQLTNEMGYGDLQQSSNFEPSMRQEKNGLRIQAAPEPTRGAAPVYVERFTKLSINFSDFNSNISENAVLELDFQWLREMFIVTRPIMTLACLIFYVVWCFSFFLKRGGN